MEGMLGGEPVNRRLTRMTVMRLSRMAMARRGLFLSRHALSHRLRSQGITTRAGRLRSSVWRPLRVQGSQPPDDGCGEVNGGVIGAGQPVMNRVTMPRTSLNRQNLRPMPLRRLWGAAVKRVESACGWGFQGS